MPKPSCVKTGVKAVYHTSKTVFELCNFIVQSSAIQRPVGRTRQLSAALCAAYTLIFPRSKLVLNRYIYEFIPTIHRPNNKSYMGILNFYLGKLWRGVYTV